jgi:hypothetical protein
MSSHSACAKCTQEARFRERGTREFYCSRGCQVQVFLAQPMNASYYAIQMKRRRNDDAVEEQGCNNERDPITLKRVSKIEPAARYTMPVNGVNYCFDLDALWTWVYANDNRHNHPLTNLPLTDVELANLNAAVDRRIQRALDAANAALDANAAGAFNAAARVLTLAAYRARMLLVVDEWGVFKAVNVGPIHMLTSRFYMTAKTELLDGVEDPHALLCERDGLLEVIVFMITNPTLRQFLDDPHASARLWHHVIVSYVPELVAFDAHFQPDRYAYQSIGSKLVAERRFVYVRMPAIAPLVVHSGVLPVMCSMADTLDDLRAAVRDKLKRMYGTTFSRTAVEQFSMQGSGDVLDFKMRLRDILGFGYGETISFQ